MAFSALGCTNVKTVLASGNVRFDSEQSNIVVLRQSIEQRLMQTFGFEIGVIARTLPDLQRLLDSDPFKAVVVDDQTRLYVTFLPDSPASTTPMPEAFAAEGFEIVRATDSEVCSVFTLGPSRETPDLMALLEKQYGSTVTTRTWKTLTRLVAAA
jgi:uncharacterized protein (DUF1697 family)